MRKTMVDKQHLRLSVRAQCQLLDVNRNRLKPRSSVAWKPGPEHHEMLELIKLAHAKDPTMGTRQLGKILKRNGYTVSRWTIGKMMDHVGLKAIYCKPRTTVPAPGNAKYPYLLRDMEVTRPDEVWATDITYIPWKRGHVYLTAILDWHTRAVLAWRISNTMEVDFCLEALKEARAVAGKPPGIVNTDQGSQYTGEQWINAVEAMGARVSMDGRGRWMDNVLIERLWRSVKHEWVLLHEYDTLPELAALLGEWIERYNTWRPHTANDGQTPWQAYRGELPLLEREKIDLKRVSESSRLSASASRLEIPEIAA
jgi:putative transposase